MSNELKTLDAIYEALRQARRVGPRWQLPTLDYLEERAKVLRGGTWREYEQQALEIASLARALGVK